MAAPAAPPERPNETAARRSGSAVSKAGYEHLATKADIERVLVAVERNRTEAQIENERNRTEIERLRAENERIRTEFRTENERNRTEIERLRAENERNKADIIKVMNQRRRDWRGALMRRRLRLPAIHRDGLGRADGGNPTVNNRSSTTIHEKRQRGIMVAPPDTTEREPQPGGAAQPSRRRLRSIWRRRRTIERVLVAVERNRAEAQIENERIRTEIERIRAEAQIENERNRTEFRTEIERVRAEAERNKADIIKVIISVALWIGAALMAVGFAFLRFTGTG